MDYNEKRDYLTEIRAFKKTMKERETDIFIFGNLCGVLGTLIVLAVVLIVYY